MNREEDWLACADPDTILTYVQGKVTERKLRLFAVACCRRIWHVMTDARDRRLVEVVERHIEGEASDEEWRAATEPVRPTRRKEARRFYKLDHMCHDLGRVVLSGEDAVIHAQHFTAQAAWLLHYPKAVPHRKGVGCGEITPNLPQIAQWAATAVHPEYKRYQPCFWNSPERAKQCDLLRDIIRSPFLRVGINPAMLSWSNGTLLKMAQKIYEERAFDLMPILADALEDAGCRVEGILKHCRQGGEHVRGCWVIDLLCKNEQWVRRPKPNCL